MATIDAMAWYICPNCKHRSVDIDGVEGFSEQAPACRRCGFGFLFELLDDYYPAPTTGFVVCDAEARILALGRGVFELTGYREEDVLGKEVMGAFGLSGFEEGKNPAELAREWGVRRLGEQARRAHEERPRAAGDGRLLPGLRRGRRPHGRADFLCYNTS